MQEVVLDLGRQFVSKLGLDPGVDTFGRWMVHYVAEQMTKAEKSEGQEKKIAEKNCFVTILKLWQHRWQLPAGMRPFESFESILSVIERLDPERQENFYYHQIPKRDDFSQSLSEGQSQWIKFAEEIDKAARVCIEFAIDKCVEESKDSETEKWLRGGSLVKSGIDTEIIRKLTNFDLSSLTDGHKEDGSTSIKNTDEIHKKYNLKKIKSRIQYLEQLSKMNNVVLEELRTSLNDNLT